MGGRDRSTKRIRAGSRSRGMKKGDLIIIILGLIITSFYPTEEKYRKIPLKELQNTRSGNYLIKSNIVNGTLFEKDIKVPTYNCEKCEGYGTFYISKRGGDITVNKFKKDRVIEERYKVVEKEETLKGRMLTVKAKYSGLKTKEITDYEEELIGE